LKNSASNTFSFAAGALVAFHRAELDDAVELVAFEGADLDTAGADEGA
jgi:hypothetical protein